MGVYWHVMATIRHYHQLNVSVMSQRLSGMLVGSTTQNSSEPKRLKTVPTATSIATTAAGSGNIARTSQQQKQPLPGFLLCNSYNIIIVSMAGAKLYCLMTWANDVLWLRR